MNQGSHSPPVKVSERYVNEGLVIAWLILKGFTQSRRQEKAFNYFNLETRPCIMNSGRKAAPVRVSLGSEKGESELFLRANSEKG